MTSGLLRNRFRVETTILRDPVGFTFDESRMPTPDAQNGGAVQTGAFWDGSNKEALDLFSIPEVSGSLKPDWWRSNVWRGQHWLQAGIGDNDDLELSGVSLQDGGIWQPQVETGVFFDLDTELYLYGNQAVEVVVSGNDLATLLQTPVQDFTPITMATFFVDEWSRPRVYEHFKQKHMLTSTDPDQPTLTQVPGSEPPLYEQRYTSIRWQYVDSGRHEFLYDAYAPGVVRSRNITTSVNCQLRRVPWSQNHFQLPLVPFVSWDTMPVFNVYEDEVNISDGEGAFSLLGSGVSNLVLTSGSYLRVSGALPPSGLVVPFTGDASAWPASGTIIIDGGDRRQEILAYGAIAGQTFSGLDLVSGVRASGVPHRDGAQIRLVVDASISGNAISGVDGAGRYLANYQVSGLPGTLEPLTGLWEIPAASGVPRITVDVQYTRGILLSYEPSGAQGLYSPDDVNVNPLTHGAPNGMLWMSMYPLRPADIKLSISRGVNADGTVGPIFAGNDYLAIEAEVVNVVNAPVPGVEVALVLESPQNVGLVDGADPSLTPTTKVTDGTGVARFSYTPPDTIQGMGYFADKNQLVNGSGIPVNETAILEEFWAAGEGWKTLAFTVVSGDEYLNYMETSGAFQFFADGRFELVTFISGMSSAGVSTWHPIRPVAALDEDGAAVTASGSIVKTLVFESGVLPVGGDVEAYFVSAEKRISIGAIAVGANTASQSFQAVIGIPPFMTGEFLWGEIEDQDTKSFDSLTYLTINPFQELGPNDWRTDPRQLGNVFRIRGQKQDEFLRNKFYIGIDDSARATLAASALGARKLRQFYTMRNRFILEVE